MDKASERDRSPKVFGPVGSDLVTETRRQRVFAGRFLNVLVNVMVLNLFEQFSDAVRIDSFWISVPTAELITLMISILSKFEAGIHHYFFETHSWQLVGVSLIWIVLFGGKLLMLEIVDFVFGDHVSSGHLLEVILLVVAMMVAGQLMQLIYDRFGVLDRSTESAATSAAGHS